MSAAIDGNQSSDYDHRCCGRCVRHAFGLACRTWHVADSLALHRRSLPWPILRHPHHQLAGGAHPFGQQPHRRGSVLGVDLVRNRRGSGIAVQHRSSSIYSCCFPHHLPRNQQHRMPACKQENRKRGSGEPGKRQGTPPHGMSILRSEFHIRSDDQHPTVVLRSLRYLGVIFNFPRSRGGVFCCVRLYTRTSGGWCRTAWVQHAVCNRHCSDCAFGAPTTRRCCLNRLSFGSVFNSLYSGHIHGHPSSRAKTILAIPRHMPSFCCARNDWRIRCIAINVSGLLRSRFASAVACGLMRIVHRMHLFAQQPYPTAAMGILQLDSRRGSEGTYATTLQRIGRRMQPHQPGTGSSQATSRREEQGRNR